jgi:hypothetical protein
MVKREQQAEERPGYELWTEILKEMDMVRIEGTRFYEKGNQSAGRRARTALDRLAKLKTAWRKETVG